MFFFRRPWRHPSIPAVAIGARLLTSSDGREQDDTAVRCQQHRGKPLSSLRVKKTASKPEISDQIGRQLRTVYNDVLAQPVPDRFLDLLKALDLPPARTETKVAK